MSGVKSIAYAYNEEFGFWSPTPYLLLKGVPEVAHHNRVIVILS